MLAQIYARLSMEAANPALQALQFSSSTAFKGLNLNREYLQYS